MISHEDDNFKIQTSSKKARMKLITARQSIMILKSNVMGSISNSKRSLRNLCGHRIAYAVKIVMIIKAARNESVQQEG